MPRVTIGLWLVTPEGHLLVWHSWAWMQPSANIMVRAELV